MKLKPIETAPKDGRYILLFGDSGYTTTPLRCEICHWEADYRPLQPWVDYEGNSFLDGGAEPLYWAEILDIPKNQDVKFCPNCGAKVKYYHNYGENETTKVICSKKCQGTWVLQEIPKNK